MIKQIDKDQLTVHLRHYTNPGRTTHLAASNFLNTGKNIEATREELIALIIEVRGIKRPSAIKCYNLIVRRSERYNAKFFGFSNSKMDYVYDFTDHKRKILFSQTTGKPKQFSVYRWNRKTRVHELKAITVFEMKAYEFERVFTSSGVRRDLESQLHLMEVYRTERMAARVDDNKIVLDKGGSFNHNDLLDMVERLHKSGNDTKKSQIIADLEASLSKLKSS